MYRWISIGDFHLHTYGIMQAIAFITVVFLMIKEGERLKIDKDIIYDFIFYIIIGEIIGARIWFVVENWSLFKYSPEDIIKIWQGGLTFYGGFIGGVIGGLLYIKIKKLNFNTFADLVGTYLPIGIGIGRIGCFLNGCCYGKVCSWGLPYPTKQSPPAYIEQLQKGLIDPSAQFTLPVIPTQLISTTDMLITFFLIYFYKKSKYYIKGTVFPVFLILYGIHRFFIDFLREYTGNALILKIITLSQFTSIILIIIGIIWYYKLYKIKKQQS